MDDHSRPLNERGRDSAPLIARWLAEQNLVPDLILCSTAIRTLQTSDLLRNEWQTPCNSDASQMSFAQINCAQINCAELYLATPNAILECLANRSQSDPQSDPQSDSLPRKVIVLGHNPGLEIFASMLSGQIVSMPTAACVVFTLDPQKHALWKIDLSAGGISKKKQVVPKEL